MKRAVITVSVLVGVQLMLLALWMWKTRQKAPAPPPSPSAVGSRALSSPRAVPLATTLSPRPAPDFRYRLPNGSLQHRTRLQGRPLLLHFWATWCPPCRKELPDLLAFSRQHNIPLLAVSFDTSWSSVRRLLPSPLPPPVVLAHDTASLQRHYSIDRFPVTYLVDRQGLLRLRINGARNWKSNALHQRIQTALRKEPPAK